MTHCDNDNYGPSTPRRLPFPQPRDEWTARTDPDRDDVTAEALNRGTLRSQMRSARRALSHAERARAAELVVHRLCGLSIVRRAPAVALYRAFDGELDPGALARWVTERGRRVLYPRHAPRAPLEFVEPTGWRTPEVGPPIPEGAPIELTAEDVVLVPGVAFDADGFRLGLGGGHYDRTLPGLSAPAIGLAFDFQCVPALPRETWDWPVSLVVTDRTLLACREGVALLGEID